MTMETPETFPDEDTAPTSTSEEIEKNLESSSPRSYLAENPGKVTAVVIVVLIAVFIAATVFSSQEPERQSLPVAPNFTLYDIDGNMFNLTDFRGNVVLLDFMTTWCEACNRSVAHTKELAEVYGSDLVIISISVDPGYDTNERLRGYMLYHDSPWIHARDIAHVGELYGVDGVPTFFLIDQEGGIFDTQVGVVPHEVFSREIEVML
jgi:thiol-disulfide isomerase/thioredoxin